MARIFFYNNLTIIQVISKYEYLKNNRKMASAFVYHSKSWQYDVFWGTLSIFTPPIVCAKDMICGVYFA